jgi:hypothetical protein
VCATLQDTAGLIRRLLLLEAIKQPLAGSLLQPECKELAEGLHNLNMAALLQPILFRGYHEENRAVVEACIDCCTRVLVHHYTSAGWLGAYDMANSSQLSGDQGQRPAPLTAHAMAALVMWARAWHSAVSGLGGGYDELRVRAAASEAACDALGPELLQRIRVPTWQGMLRDW